MTLEERYRSVVARVGARARLIAVSKAATVEDVRALYALGQRDFGENRADQLAERAAQLPPDIRWHFIGNIQSNKLRVLAQVRPLVHSFDRLDLVAKWPREAPVLVQVDFTGRKDRNGLAPSALAGALETLAKAGVPVRGLSTLPPADADPRPVFRQLRALRDEHGLSELSMGMSDDLEAALDEGATMVRVGRAILRVAVAVRSGSESGQQENPRWPEDTRGTRDARKSLAPRNIEFGHLGHLGYLGSTAGGSTYALAPVSLLLALRERF